MAQRLILDVDTGTDDAVALMFAALHPDLELLAATTVNGNVPVQNCTENSLRTFDYIGASVPVYQGMQTPMARPDFPVPRAVKGTSPIHGDYLPIPEATSKPQPEHAVDFIVRTLLASPGDITIVAVGPLSNIGMAIRRAPEIVPKIKQLVIMGGGHEIGNETPAAEFNIWADPEAARAVVNSGVDPITLVPLDATHKALVSLDDCKTLRDIGTPAALAAAMFTERRIEGYDTTQPMRRKNAAPIHDALAVASLIDPDLLDTHHLHVDVETVGTLTVGRTVIDTHFRSRKDPNVHVALDANEKRFVELLEQTLGRTAG